MEAQIRVKLRAPVTQQKHLRILFSCTPWTLQQESKYGFWFESDDFESAFNFACSLESITNGEVFVSCQDLKR